MAQENDLSLTYLVRQPSIPSDHPSVLILLHGFGSNEADLFGLSEYLPKNMLVVCARAPITQSMGSYAWYHVDFSGNKPSYNLQEEERARLKIIQFIDEVKKKYKVSSSNLILGGFSQGGIMSYSVALTRPDLMKGIAVMSGRLLEEIKSSKADDKLLGHLKIFISHGTKDATLTVEYAHRAYEFLKQENLPITFNTYAAGHEINLEMIKDLNKWLNE